jgi:hypothetical protein
LRERRTQKNCVGAFVELHDLDLHGAGCSGTKPKDHEAEEVLRAKINSGEGGDTLHPESRARKPSPVKSF